MGVACLFVHVFTVSLHKPTESAHLKHLTVIHLKHIISSVGSQWQLLPFQSFSFALL
jgi:hypothetical protein